ncbi:reverse transcriptase domain-containing protein, partial [Tanacetum coccineum]
MFHRPLILLQIVQLILFIVDSGCTKHMTGNLKLLCNFVEKFLGTVRFGNDQFAPILGYGDLIQGGLFFICSFTSCKKVQEKLRSLWSSPSGQNLFAGSEVIKGSEFSRSVCWLKCNQELSPTASSLPLGALIDAQGETSGSLPCNCNVLPNSWSSLSSSVSSSNQLLSWKWNTLVQLSCAVDVCRVLQVVVGRLWSNWFGRSLWTLCLVDALGRVEEDCLFDGARASLRTDIINFNVLCASNACIESLVRKRECHENIPGPSIGGRSFSKPDAILFVMHFGLSVEDVVLNFGVVLMNDYSGELPTWVMMNPSSMFSSVESTCPTTAIDCFDELTRKIWRCVFLSYLLAGGAQCSHLLSLSMCLIEDEDFVKRTPPVGLILKTEIQISTSMEEGVLPSNTVPNPREDLKAITTRSGVTLAGPSVPPHPLSSFAEPSPASTSSELPPAPISSPVILEPNPHQPKIPYPSRLNKEKLQDKADIQIHSFLQMFKKIYFNISFAEALTYMPKFAKMVKDLLTNKEKLIEMANTPLNENCSAVLLKKLPKKLRDIGRFLIPCDFYGFESCMALADLGASINLMPLSVWKKLSLPEISPTRMTLELATQTVAYPAGIAEDVFVQVGKFTFSADFVVVDYDVDPRVPLILGRPFLRTAHALVDVHGEELTLRVGDEKLVFNVESTSRYPRKHGDESIHKIDILDITCEDHFHDVLNVQKGSDFILEEIATFLASDESTSPDDDDGTFDMEGDIRLIETLLNNDISNDLPPPLPVCVINETEKIKSSIDDPPDLKLKDLPPHLEYAFLEGTSKLPVIIAKDLKREEKEQLLKVLKSHKHAIAWKISDIRGIDPNFFTHKIFMEDDFKPAVQHQRRVNPKIHEVIKAEVIKLLDAGLIYPISDSPWEKCHFMVKEGIVLGHKVSKYGIEVDKAKVDVIAKLPPLTMKLTEAPILVSLDWDLPFELMCNASDFAIGAVLGQRKDKYFSHVHYASKTLSDAQTNYTVTEKELLDVVYAFEKFRSYLVLSKTIVYTDHSDLKYLFAKQDAKPRLLRWILLLQEFNIEIRDKKRAENLAADHLSRLENPQEDHVGMKINDNFPHETLNMISLNPYNEPSWFADIANYLVGFVLIRLFGGVWTGKKLWIFSKLATMVPPGDIMARTTLPRKFSTLVSSGLTFIAMPMTWSHTVTHVNVREKSHRGTKFPKILFRFVRSLTSGASTLWARSRLHEGSDIYSWLSTMCLNGLKRKRSPLTMPEL